MFLLALFILGSFVIAFGSFLNALLFCAVWITLLVLLGRYLGIKYGPSIDGTMEKVMQNGMIWGILCGIAMVVIGFFKDAGYETVSYEDWHGNTVSYIADRISNLFYFGFVVFALSFTVMFLYFAYFMAKDKYVPKEEKTNRINTNDKSNIITSDREKNTTTQSQNVETNEPINRENEQFIHNIKEQIKNADTVFACNMVLKQLYARKVTRDEFPEIDELIAAAEEKRRMI